MELLRLCDCKLPGVIVVGDGLVCDKCGFGCDQEGARIMAERWQITEAGLAALDGRVVPDATPDNVPYAGEE